ncbi:3'-5' exonuclease [Pseudomonas extremaustralis]|uniref:3'-5' exonuclease n=1 Tax=Pseudomonas extremaustralis TaxID=359110 RepID=A0A5C5QBN7_9PSED|nr:3'-5' exonuclease [Pseudomonas extremaustralis]EZI23138.1 exodeoxyribonuclease X [Pseudomonas extremaustralis 14-3 substr. 14-3b]TWS02850.1 3'-5' exonuclease [Pseudomonas extremaustralis]SDE69338.1 exodeoxyribonuclease X [Pseudomonas extremaustralis]
MTAYIFDSETTGLNDPHLIEAAWLQLESISSLAVTADFLQRYKPGKPIELSALATCHILDEELAGFHPHTDFNLPIDVEYLIGHNVDYDWRVIGEPDVKRICTQALSSKLWPDADSHTQSAMIYLHYRAEATGLLRNAHAALDDVKNCRLLLVKILDQLAAERGRQVSDWEELWQISEDARIPTIIGFGKHKGAAFADLPSDYRRWLLNQPDLDPFVRKALMR